MDHWNNYRKKDSEILIFGLLKFKTCLPRTRCNMRFSCMGKRWIHSTFHSPQKSVSENKVKLGHEFQLGDKKYWVFSYKKKFLSYTGIWSTWIICLSMYKADWNINITEVNSSKKKVFKRYWNFKMLGIGSYFVFCWVILSKYE